MQISKITCSDLREHNDIGQVLELLDMSPLVELGIQAHDMAMNRNLPRHKWFEKLRGYSERAPRPLNIAIHVNGMWCSKFCYGNIMPELAEWLGSRNKNTGEWTIKRWQLNVGDHTEAILPGNAAEIISEYPGREFIVPMNSRTKSFVYDLRLSGANFSVLHDASYGAGGCPDKWEAPAFDDMPQGYAGGLCAETLVNSLFEISMVVPKKRKIWIDAEGRLMRPKTREFDMLRARNYVHTALNWIEENQN